MTRLLAVLALLVGGASAPAADFSGAAAARGAMASLLKVPLAAPEVSVTVHEATEQDGLITEDVSWESLDHERVPAFVMRRADAPGRLPVVICLHGSGGSREAMSTARFGYEKWTTPGRSESHTRLIGWARELARRGYLAIAMTQRGLDRRRPPINQQANVLLVQGRTAMGAVLHEIRQAVTYAARRPDADPARIATAGLSFGGITAFYTWVLDDRVAAAAPICGGVGSVDVFAQRGSIGYHGTYWWIPGMLAEGDQADFAAAMAPKPLMLWAPTADIGMPKEGVDLFRRKVADAYGRAGRPDTLVIHQPPGEHAFTTEAFEAMSRFFDTHLKRREP